MGDCKPDCGCYGGGGGIFGGGDNNIWWLIIIVVIILCFCPGIFGGSGFGGGCNKGDPCC